MTEYVPYSRRLEELERVGQPRIYEYDRVPLQFRVQLVHILRDVIGKGEERQSGSWLTKNSRQPITTPAAAWEVIHDMIARELGVFTVYDPPDYAGSDSTEAEAMLVRFLVDENTETPQLLDAIELAFRFLVTMSEWLNASAAQFVRFLTAAQGVEELNRRFQEHSLGYFFDRESQLIIRVDSEYLHTEAVLPALRLLRRTGFEGAEKEFLRAQAHSRHGRYEESMVDALKAFESTMKLICDERQWTYDPDRDTANKLISILVQQGLIPDWALAEFTSLRSMLESGLPTARNRNAGHGRGSDPRQIPNFIAAFALHMAAVNIVLLVEAFNALPPSH